MKVIDVLTSPWAIIPSKLEEIRQIYVTHLRGDQVDLRAIEAAAGAPLQRAEQGYEVHDGVALISIDGVIAKRMNLFTQISGGASSELIARDLRQAAADPSVRAIVLAIDSPGGTVDGTQTLANQVASIAAGEKPVVAFADGTMASAAYWIGAAADSILISGDTVNVGSIGVAMAHVDVTKAEEQAGYKTTEIFAGKYKRIASQYSALSQDGREYLQGMVDQIYTTFVDDVARHRGTTAERVVADMADGRIFIGKRAIAAGLVDGVSTLEALVSQLARGGYSRRRRRATSEITTAPPLAIAPHAPSIAERCQAAWFASGDLRKKHASFATFLRYETAKAEANEGHRGS